MGRIVTGLCLSLLSGVAFAQTPAVAPARDQEAPVATVAEETVNADTPKLAEVNDRNCLRHTGTRIKRRDKDGCINAPGRSYDKDDIDSTGASTAAEALERLDPSVSIRR